MRHETWDNDKDKLPLTGRNLCETDVCWDEERDAERQREIQYRRWRWKFLCHFIIPYRDWRLITNIDELLITDWKWRWKNPYEAREARFVRDYTKMFVYRCYKTNFVTSIADILLYFLLNTTFINVRAVCFFICVIQATSSGANCSLTQISYRPITWQHLKACRHGEGYRLLNRRRWFSDVSVFFYLYNK